MVNQLLQEDIDALVIQYGSMAPMEGLTGVYFMEYLMSATTSFYVDYPGSTDPAGKLNVAFQNMVIEVHIEQGETFDSKGQLVSNWIPVLSVYGL